MKTFVMRGFSAGLFLLFFLLASVLIAFSLFACFVLQSDTIPTGVSLFVRLICCMFILLPGIKMLLDGIIAIYTKIEICEDKVKFVKPFFKSKILEINQITHFGCVAYAPRSCMLFFCTEDTPSLNKHLESHWDQCVKIFGTKRVNRLKGNEHGYLQLAVGTYLRNSLMGRNDKVFVLQYGSPKRLYQVVRALKRGALLTGPSLIDDEVAWKRYSIYTNNSNG